MKLVRAVVRPHLVDEVRHSLLRVGVGGMTVFPVEGFGQQRGHQESYRGVPLQVEFMPKAMIEVAVPDALLERTVDAVVAAARTGEVGDGKIFVISLDDVVRIRTGERGREAL
jgi:nitrogen regulatory protein PII